MKSSFGVHARTLAFGLSAALAFAGSSACSASEDEEVRGRLDAVMSSSSALSVGGVTAIYGTYGAGCSGRTDGEAWAIGVEGSTNLAHAALSVRKNDADCVLSLTDVVSSAGHYGAGAEHALDASFAASPVVFSSTAAEPTQILVNAKLSAASFASDFGISVFVSTLPSTASATMVATRAVTYGWTTGAWKGCDTTCGVGTNTRQVSCIDLSTSATAPDAMCDASQKPVATESCEDHSQCSAPDVTAPSLVSMTPASGAVGVAADVVLTATYDEPLAAQSSVTLKRSSTAVTGTTSINGNTITFTPSAALRLTVTTYTAQFIAVDASGNQTVTSITFTTRDATPPMLMDTYPANGNTAIPRAVNLVTGANEPIASQSTVKLTKVSDGSVIAGTTTIDGTVIVFDPTSMLAANTAYKGVFTIFDAAGNKTVAEVQFTTGTSSF